MGRGACGASYRWSNRVTASRCDECVSMHRKYFPRFLAMDLCIVSLGPMLCTSADAIRHRLPVPSPSLYKRLGVRLLEHATAASGGWGSLRGGQGRMSLNQYPFGRGMIFGFGALSFQNYKRKPTQTVELKTSIKITNYVAPPTKKIQDFVSIYSYFQKAMLSL